MSLLTDSLDALSLEEMPGFRIRRLQLISVAIVLEETQGFGITPVQFSTLTAIQREPGLDQRTLAKRIGLDTSTLGCVIDRLEARGLVARSNNPSDRRVRLLKITPAGVALLREMVPHVHKAQSRLLAPLTTEQRNDFMNTLQILIKANNVQSRAPNPS